MVEKSAISAAASFHRQNNVPKKSGKFPKPFVTHVYATAGISRYRLIDVAPIHKTAMFGTGKQTQTADVF